MRNLVTVAATALTLGFMSLATPAFADQNSYGGNGGYNANNQHQNQQYRDDRLDNDQSYQGQGNWNARGRNFDRRFDFDRHEGRFDRWERGWNNRGFDQFRHHQPLSHARLVRRLEAQGYYGVRGLRPSRFGLGWRAFAFTGRGRPVMLQVNPYTGRVLNARYV